MVAALQFSRKRKIRHASDAYVIPWYQTLKRSEMSKRMLEMQKHVQLRFWLLTNSEKGETSQHLEDVLSFV